MKLVITIAILIALVVAAVLFFKKVGHDNPGFRWDNTSISNPITQAAPFKPFGEPVKTNKTTKQGGKADISCTQHHRVVKGDSFWKLAERFSSHSDYKSWIQAVKFKSGLPPRSNNLPKNQRVCVAW